MSHLVRLLRIKRLIQLGLSLPRIAELGDADEHPERRCEPWTPSWPGLTRISR